MKRPTNFTVTNFILQRTLFFLSLVAVWSLKYAVLQPYLASSGGGAWCAGDEACAPVRWLADAATMFAPLFDDAFCGSWALAFLSLVTLLASDVILWQLFKYRRMQCLAFVPATVVTLAYMPRPLPALVQWAAVLSLVALVLFVVTYRKRYIRLSFDSRRLLLVTNLLPYVLTVVTVAGVWLWL